MRGGLEQLSGPEPDRHNGRLYSRDGRPGRDSPLRRQRRWSYLGIPHRNGQIHTMGLYRGQLIAGAWPEGLVCRHEGAMEWTRCGVLGLRNGLREENQGAINEINDLTVHNGKLYAGAIPKGEVYRYEEGTDLTLNAPSCLQSRFRSSQHRLVGSRVMPHGIQRAIVCRD